MVVTELGVGATIVAVVGTLMGGVLAFVKMLESKNAIIKCGCCGNTCELDCRSPETRQKIVELEMQKTKTARIDSKDSAQ